MAGFLQSLIARARELNASEEFPLQAPPSPDLGSLGILEIRPKEKASATTDRDETLPISEESGGEDDDDSFQLAADEGASSKRAVDVETDAAEPSRRDVISIRARESARTLAVEAVGDPFDEAFLIPCLSSIRAVLEAHTVCLLLQDGSPTRYRIMGTVSRSSYARTAGRFMTKSSIFPAEAKDNVAIVEVGRNPSESVRYYRERLAIREMLVARVDVKKQRYLLVADSMHRGVFDSDYKLKMLRQAVYYVSTYLGHKAEQDGLAGDSIVIKPRREIIGDEITIARRTQRPLALALVYLNNAEAIAKKGPEEVKRCENEVRDRLYRHTNHGRIEQFGELTFGIFIPGDVHDAEEWVLNIQSVLTPQDEDDFLDGISVGVAMLRDRHKTPQEFRADATAALREAFETGSCTILE